MANTKCLLLAAAASTALLTAPAFAQTPAKASATSTATADDADTAREIIVTARKRSENLQDVPVAITAFDSLEIRSARIERLADLAKLTPGLNYTPLFGAQNQLPIIRGAAQTIGQLNVGIFLDGIYLSGKAAADLELNDLERIEVVKGPQSALYGRNTFAGAINYITRRPSADLTGNAEATIGDSGLYKVAASISGPLGDKVRLRIGGFYREFGGFYTSSIDGGKVDFSKNYGGIGTLELTPTEALTATFRVSYSKDDNGQPPSNVIRNNSAPGVPAGASPTQRRNLLFVGNVPEIPQDGVLVNTLSVPGLPGGSYGDREDIIRASADFEYDFGGAVLTSITAYAHRNSEFTFDGDNTVCDRSGGCPNFGFPFAPAIPRGKSDFALSSSDGFSRDWSQEVRLASGGKQRFEWLLGAFYYNNRTAAIDRGITLPGTLAITDYSAGAAAYRYPRARIDTKAYSLFGSAIFHVTDAFSVNAELRYEKEDVAYVQGPANPAGTAGSATVYDLKAGFDFWTPRVILNYKASDDVLVYASYARGAKTGGFNTGINVLDSQRAYFPEFTDNYEIGFKSDLMDRRLRLNMAAFYTDWKDQQAACQNPVTGPGQSSTNRTYICNVAASKIYGVEVEATARLADWFTVSGNYAYTHARYSRFVDASLAQTLALAGLPAIDFDGKRLPYVPEHKIVVSPRINVPLGGRLEAEFRADLQMQSRSFVRADNFQRFEGFENVDLRATLRSGGVSLQVFVNNLFDNATPVAGVRFFDAANYSISSPYVTGANRRLIGASLGYRF